MSQSSELSLESKTTADNLCLSWADCLASSLVFAADWCCELCAEGLFLGELEPECCLDNSAADCCLDEFDADWCCEFLAEELCLDETAGEWWLSCACSAYSPVKCCAVNLTLWEFASIDDRLDLGDSWMFPKELLCLTGDVTSADNLCVPADWSADFLLSPAELRVKSRALWADELECW